MFAWTMGGGQARRTPEGSRTRAGSWLGLLGVLVFAMAAGACGGGGGGGTTSAAPSGEGALFEVTNNNRSEVTLWAQIEGRRQRLGTLQPNGQATYTLDVRGIQDVALEIRVLGGGRCTTQTRPVGPGERIITIIPPQLSMMQGCR